MPDPQIGETRTHPHSGETRMWTGTGWLKTPGGGAPAAGGPPNMLQPPPSGQQRPPTTQEGLELLKQILTTGGTMAGGFLGGPTGSILGGAAGRTVGHVPEALYSYKTGEPNASSFLGDAAIGATEGAAQEVAPAALGAGLKYGGMTANALGTLLGKAPSYVRGVLGHYIGGVPGAVTAAALPPILRSGGRASQDIGEAIGTRTLSQRLQGLRSAGTSATKPDQFTDVRDISHPTQRPVPPTLPRSRTPPTSAAPAAAPTTIFDPVAPVSGPRDLSVVHEAPEDPPPTAGGYFGGVLPGQPAPSLEGLRVAANGPAPAEIDLSDQLGSGRSVAQERAQERFGRTFRSEGGPPASAHAVPPVRAGFSAANQPSADAVAAANARMDARQMSRLREANPDSPLFAVSEEDQAATTAGQVAESARRRASLQALKNLQASP